jgi:hypothetical protein
MCVTGIKFAYVSMIFQLDLELFWKCGIILFLFFVTTVGIFLLKIHERNKINVTNLDSQINDFKTLVL